MVRIGTPKRVDDGHWKGRLKKARGFHKIAAQALMLAEPSDDASPIILLCRKAPSFRAEI